MSDEIQRKVDEFEARLGLPKGFYYKLLKEDDWSFVIKISALIEAASTHILSYKFRHPELEENFSYLEQGNRKIGRVALLKKTKALFDNQARTLFSLAELRNSLAHDIKNTNFTFEDHIAGLDKNQKSNFIRDFGDSIKDEFTIEDQVVKKTTFVLENPKLSIWLACHEIIACLYIEIEKTHIDVKLGPFAGLLNLTKPGSAT